MIAGILRKWRVFLVCSLLGAVSLGAYQWLNTGNEPPVPALSQVEIAKIQEQVAKNEAEIVATHERIFLAGEEITANDNTIAANQEVIENNLQKQKDIALEQKKQKLTIGRLEELLEHYKTELEVALRLEDSIYKSIGNIISLVEKISDVEVQITQRQQQIQQMGSDSANLIHSNVELHMQNNKLEQANKQLDENISDGNEKIQELYEENQKATQRLNATMPAPLTLGNVVKNAIVGIVFGIGVAAVYAVVMLCMDNRIHTARELEDRFEVTLLGTVPVAVKEDNKKRCVVDRWVDCFEQGRRGAALKDEAAVVAAKIQLLSQTNKVLITGTVKQQALELAAQEIKRHFSGTAPEILVREDPLLHPEVLEALKTYEPVLVEKPGASDAKELSALLKMLEESNTRVLGMVAI